MRHYQDQSGYHSCSEGPDNDGNELLPLDVIRHVAARDREAFGPYERTTSEAESAASSETGRGFHRSHILHDHKAPAVSLQSSYGDDQAVEWEQSHHHAPAVSKARTKRFLQSSLNHLDDSMRMAWAKYQDLVDFLQDSWLLEIGACVTALVLFIAEIVLLRVFEKHQVSTWPWRWSLNSAVALVTTLIEANLVFALTSCLGQMKWLWFSLDQGTMKPLIWVDLIARANTPLGALSLLLRPTTWR
jgi:hypothetical protein